MVAGGVSNFTLVLEFTAENVPYPSAFTAAILAYMVSPTLRLYGSLRSIFWSIRHELMLGFLPQSIPSDSKVGAPRPLSVV